MNPLNTAKSFYLPSLDGLRLIAFLMIFIFHSFTWSDYQGNILAEIVQKSSWFGIDLFFVLSGFLITSLLLIEREKYGQFSIKKFLIRRSLRIWPLFFLGLFFGVAVIPVLSNLILKNYTDPKFINDIFTKIPWYLIFLGNWSMIFQGFADFRNIANLWTIAVEIQFYLVWPFLLLTLNSFRKFGLVSLTIIFGSIFYKYLLALSNAGQNMIFMNTLARLDTLLIGSLLAAVYFYKYDWVRKFSQATNSLTLILVYIIFLLISYFANVTKASDIFSVTFGFAIIAILMAFFVHSAIQVEVFRNFLSLKYLVFLGKISYGLYVWHIFVINFFKEFFSNSPILKYSLIFELLITIVIGIASYYLYESHFLKLKDRFTKIKTRVI